MINPAELGRTPIGERPILTDEQVKGFVRGQIQYIVGQVQVPIRAFVVDARSYTRLFAMRGQEQYGLLTRGFGSNTRVAGRVETSRSQELAFEVMKEFGFDPNAVIDEHESKSFVGEQIVQKIATYPSKTIGGLVFDRVTEYALGDETPFRVEWRARDAAHRFRIGSRDTVKVA